MNSENEKIRESEIRFSIDYRKEIINEVIQDYINEGHSIKIAKSKLLKLINTREACIMSFKEERMHYPSLIEFRKLQKMGKL